MHNFTLEFNKLGLNFIELLKDGIKACYQVLVYDYIVTHPIALRLHPLQAEFWTKSIREGLSKFVLIPVGF